MLDCDIPVVVVTGGPCGGKSELLAEIDRFLRGHDIHPVVVPEAATELISRGRTPDVLGVEAFQEELLLHMLDQENQRVEEARLLGSSQHCAVLCDRGALDLEAYMGQKACRRLLQKMRITRSTLRDRYTLVIHMVTAADGAEEHYTLSNNSARSETPEQARELDRKTQHAWLNHPHHIIIDNSTPFEEKKRRAVKALARKLNMPEPTEIERKFRIFNFTPESIPEDAVAVHMTQDYLTPSGHGVRRVRKVLHNNDISYYFTEKIPTDNPAVRIEKERLISKAEYQTLLCEKDPLLEKILKTRHRFVHKGKRFELDVFTSPALLGLVLLEIELLHTSEPFEIPNWWFVKEVTTNPAYTNHALAQIR